MIKLASVLGRHLWPQTTFNTLRSMSLKQLLTASVQQRRVVAKQALIVIAPPKLGRGQVTHGYFTRLDHTRRPHQLHVKAVSKGVTEFFIESRTAAVTDGLLFCRI
jgi:hypothetical protein